MLGARRRRLHGSEHQLLLRRLPEPAPVEPPALHLPGRSERQEHHAGRRTSRPRSRPPANGGISADGKTYTIKIRPGVKWDTTPARQVTAADVVRGVKRTANPVQPFGGIAGLRRPDRRLPDVRRRVRQGAEDRRRNPGLHRQDAVARRGGQGRQHGRLPPHPAGQLLRRHAHAAGLLAGPGRGPEVPPGEHRARQQLPVRRPVQGRLVGSDASRSTTPATPPGIRPATRSARRTSTRSWSTRPSPRTRSSSNCRPVRRTPTWSSTSRHRRPSCRPCRPRRTRTSRSVTPRVRNPYVIYNTVSPNNNKALAEPEGPAGDQLRDQPRPHPAGARRQDARLRR